MNTTRDRRHFRRWAGLLALAIVVPLLPLGPAALATTPAVDSGLQLNGTTQYVTFGAAPGLDAAQFTLELWFKRTGTGAATSTGATGITAIPLLTKGRAEAEGSNVDMNYFLGIDSATNKLAVDFEEGPGGAGPLGANHPFIANTVITSNVWHHAAATYDGTWKIYLDGALDGTLAVNQPPRSDSIQHAALGTAMTSAGAPAGFFAGVVDEPRIWNAARTQAQIQSSMNTEVTSAPNLIGRWGLNEGTGNLANDSSGSGINGNLVATPAWVAGAPFGNSGLQLNGTTQYVTFGAAPGLDAAQFTLELWFKRTGTGAATSTGATGITAIPLLTKGRAEAEGSNVDMNYFLGIDSATNKLAVDFEEGPGGAGPLGANHPFIANTVITSNVWHHAAATYDGTWKIYLDGALDGTLAVNQPPRSDSIQHAALGTAMTSAGAPAGFFAGVVDEPRIWNAARTQAQIQSSMNTEVTSAPNLIGRWGLNEGTGNLANDSSGSGINGTLVATPAWVNGAPFSPFAGNSGLQLNGTTQYVTFGAAPGLDAAQFTLELWFKRTGTGAATSTGATGITAIPLLTKGRAEAEGSNVDMNYFLGIDSATNKLAVDFEEGPGGAGPLGANHPFIANTVITSNVWHHAAATYDGTWKIYLDGALDGTLAVNQPPRSDSIQHAALGTAMTSAGAPAGFFAGVVDEPRIWNAARTQAQIQSSMNTEVTSAPNLIGRWGLNEGTGNLANDSSGSGINGTLVATPAWVAGFPVVTNTAPVVDSVTIDQSAPSTNDVLTATVSAHDGENNPLTYAYRWTKNGTDIAGATSATLNLGGAGNGDKGDAIRVRVSANDGTVDSTPVTSSPVTVANTAPSATVGLDDTSPTTSQTITATATKADADGDAVSLTYVWKVNGTTKRTQVTTALTDAFDLSISGNGDNGDTVTVTVTPNDGTADGSAATDTATVGNTAPVVDSVVIDQASPRTGDTLSATVTGHDPDGDGLTYAYRWTKNGTDIAGATSATLNLGGAGNGDKGDAIRVRVSANDGTVDSTPVTSSPVTVANTAPSATVGLDDTSPTTSQTITATATKADADGDAVSLTYVWKVNGTTKRTQVTTALTDAFDLSISGNGDNGDTVTVTVTPNDGTADGSAATDTATVGNTAPVVDSVVIDQASPRTGDTLSATVTGHDPDGDGLTYAYRWTKNGTDIAGATSATLNLGGAGNGDKGDAIRVRVSANDGTVDSTPVTSSPVTVANTAPSATVGLDDTSPTTSQTINATATKADADGDAVSLTYVWKVNGTTKRTQVTTALTDPFDLSISGNGDNGDTVTVTVTPNDGTADGSAATDTATVGNTAPVVDSVVIDQASPRTGDTLSATVTGHDPDGDGLTYAYRWTKNGTDIAGATSATLNLGGAGNGDKGDAIRVRVSANDGTVDSTPVTSSPVTVANTAPVIDSVAIQPASPGTNDLLTAVVTSHDADGDARAYSYQWRKNGVDVAGATTATYDLAAAGKGDKGAHIRVVVTASDGTSSSASVQSPQITVVDTAPVATVALSTHTPGTNQVLTATATKADADGDAVTLTYVWKVNGTTKRTQVTTALTDAFDLSISGNGDNGDTVTVTVTPNDGTLDGSAVTDTATVTASVNTPPVAQPGSWTVTKNLAKSITLVATDANGDGLTYQIVTNPAHGTLSGTGATRTYTPVHNYTGADSFTFKANDGQADSNTATVSITVKAPLQVTISDAGYSKASVAPAQGVSVKWTNSGSTAHTVTDASGMGLFDSGPIAPGGSFTFTFTAAGTYTYLDSTHPSFTATVKVPVIVTPGSGGTGTTFTVTWASEALPAGYVYDAQIKRPGNNAFVAWQTGLSTLSASFVPDAGTGTYSFRARLRNTTTNTSSGYSAAKAITVT